MGVTFVPLPACLPAGAEATRSELPWLELGSGEKGYFSSFYTRLVGTNIGSTRRDGAKGEIRRRKKTRTSFSIFSSLILSPFIPWPDEREKNKGLNSL